MIDAWLFPHETLYAQERCTLTIAPEQLGLPMVGFGGKPTRALGGTLMVSQYRVLFEAVNLGPTRGMTSLLLDTITDVAETPAKPFPRMVITAGVAYQAHCFSLDRLRTALTQVIKHSAPDLRHAARLELARVFYPQGTGAMPLRAAVRATLDQTTVTPENVLDILTLSNLWLSLGND